MDTGILAPAGSGCLAFVGITQSHLLMHWLRGAVGGSGERPNMGSDPWACQSKLSTWTGYIVLLPQGGGQEDSEKQIHVDSGTLNPDGG